MEHAEVTAPVAEEQPAVKQKTQHPLMFAAGCTLILLYIAFNTYDWLRRKVPIAGPEFYDETAPLYLGLALINLASTKRKHRWEKIVTLILVPVTLGLILFGVINALFLFLPDFSLSMLAIVSSMAAIIIYVIILITDLPNGQREKVKLTRKQKIRTAITLILALAIFFALWFGPRHLILWLLTRG